MHTRHVNTVYHLQYIMKSMFLKYRLLFLAVQLGGLYFCTGVQYCYICSGYYFQGSRCNDKSIDCRLQYGNNTALNNIFCLSRMAYFQGKLVVACVALGAGGKTFEQSVWFKSIA